MRMRSHRMTVQLEAPHMVSNCGEIANSDPGIKFCLAWGLHKSAYKVSYIYCLVLVHCHQHFVQLSSCDLFLRVHKLTIVWRLFLVDLARRLGCHNGGILCCWSRRRFSSWQHAITTAFAVTGGVRAVVVATYRYIFFLKWCRSYKQTIVMAVNKL